MISLQRRTAHGVLMYLRPAFMAPAIGMSAYGGLLAKDFRLFPAMLHGLAVGLALYVAHVNDGYVDAHIRDEEPPVLSARVNRMAAGGSSLLFFLLLSMLVATAGLSAAAATLLLWFLAVLHAPYLDTNPVTVTVDYPLGIGFAVIGGYLTQAERLSRSLLAVALVIAVLLSGIKVSIDRLDHAFDQSIDKYTVPVVLGDEAATAVSAAVMILAAVLVMGFVAVGLLPPLVTTASAFPILAAAVGYVGSKEATVRVQMLLTYPFTAVLFVGYCSTLACRPIFVLPSHLFLPQPSIGLL